MFGEPENGSVCGETVFTAITASVENSVTGNVFSCVFAFIVREVHAVALGDMNSLCTQAWL